MSQHLICRCSLHHPLFPQVPLVTLGPDTLCSMAASERMKKSFLTYYCMGQSVFSAMCLFTSPGVGLGFSSLGFAKSVTTCPRAFQAPKYCIC